ncbi:hypothetical protein MMC28_008508 [Mycoblastus sanguinarius]|nr:hypothetical protein [Mycoblastus sanguinarius]
MSQLEHDFSLSPVETTSPNGVAQANLDQNSSQSPSDQVPTGQKRATPPANGTSGLNSRSCTTCRKRKVKCDKRHPCSNCNRAAIECIFPGPGRAPRRSRKPPDTELLARLRRLEGVVQSLGKGVDEEGETIIEEEAEDTKTKPPETNGSNDVPVPKNCGLLGAHQPKKDGDEKANGIVKEFGRLVVEEGRSRYVSNKFWNSLSEEVAEMRDILDDPTDEEDDYPSPGSGSGASANHQGFIFNFSSTIFSLRNFHPPPEQIPTYWNIFKSNIDPVIKLLHIPHYENLVSQASEDLDNISKPMEVLMFTLYFSAVTSLSADDCTCILGLEKQATLRKYRFAVEQALARAGFLSTQELMVLQSMLLFLTCVRRSDDTRYVWTVTGLLIRLAQALGVHRDGQQFGLLPFETEMRRRLWWQICTLDVRASEDHGCDPSIIEQSFDTKFPLNINDRDITPSMKEAPPEHEGATEMTFDLIRYSVSTTVRRLSYAPPGPGPCRVRNAGLSLEDKEHMIEDLHQYLEKKYLRHCDTTVPLHWVAATVARLIMAKMWLVVHHPFQRSDHGEGLPQETKNRLFLTSVEVIEFSRLLETEKTTLKWGWLFRTYVQWHALAFVLSQLCTRTTGPEVDKAWMVIEGVFDDWGGSVSSNQRGMLWKPLRKLMAKARAERSKALEKQARFPLDGSLGPSFSSIGIPPGPMSTMDGTNDFSGFDSSMPVSDSFPVLTPESNGSSGLQQPYIPTETTQLNGMNNADQWVFDPSAFAQDRLIAPDENMNWSGWDDMVKDYQMETENTQGMPKGPGWSDGMINWW